METILDFELTPEEQDLFFGQFHLSREKILRLDQDSNLSFLATLFNRRGNRDAALAYIERIQSPPYRRTCRQGLRGDVNQRMAHGS